MRVRCVTLKIRKSKYFRHKELTFFRLNDESANNELLFKYTIPCDSQEDYPSSLHDVNILFFYFCSCFLFFSYFFFLFLFFKLISYSKSLIFHTSLPCKSSFIVFLRFFSIFLIFFLNIYYPIQYMSWINFLLFPCHFQRLV